MKISLFNKRIVNRFLGILSTISVITSIIFLFVSIDETLKVGIGIVVLALLVVLYFAIWIGSKMRRSIILKINASEIEVKFGDIFKECADLKVIGFNEYFDTLVDGRIISAASLNGQYIEKFYRSKVAELDAIISSDAHLGESCLYENEHRPQGKSAKYKLGTICVVNDYLLTALSRFDKDNRAYLEMIDYISCLLNFWNEVDRVYAGRSIALPILGSGITRFKGYENISDQELLELIIWTFKVSRIKFTYPSKVKIIAFERKSERINLLSLKDLES